MSENLMIDSLRDMAPVKKLTLRERFNRMKEFKRSKKAAQRIIDGSSWHMKAKFAARRGETSIIIEGDIHESLRSGILKSLEADGYMAFFLHDHLVIDWKKR